MAVSTLGSGVTPVAGSRSLAAISDGVTYTFSTGLTSTNNVVTTNDSEIQHDSLSGFVAAEHIDWSAAGAEQISDTRITEDSVTQHEAAIDHDSLSNFVAHEHIDWTSTTYDLETTGSVVTDNLKLGTGPTVDEIEETLTNNSGAVPTSAAVYAHVTEVSGITMSASDVEYTSTTISNSAVETTILTNSNIDNGVYEEGNLYRLTIMGTYGAMGTLSATIRVKLGSTTLATVSLPVTDSGETNAFKVIVNFGAIDGTNSMVTKEYLIVDTTGDQTIGLSMGSTIAHGTGNTITVTGQLSTDSASGLSIYFQHIEKLTA